VLLHLNVPYVRDEIRKHSQRYADRMERHSNIFTELLMRSIHALKRRFPQDND
jgi:hypothetical protein